MPQAEATTELQLRFFEEALEMLAEDGYGVLKQATLCRRLGVTTGAFYHSFGSWQEFTSRLLEHWRTERTTRFAELARQAPDALTGAQSLVVAALGLSHDAEAAIRVWAGVDDDVRRVLDGVDAERLAAVVEAFEGLTGDPVLSERLARWSMYVLVGYQQAGALRDPATLAWIFEAIQRKALTPDRP